MKTVSVLGIMSGTSIDGVDYALCRVNEARIELKEFWSAKFPRALQERLHRAARGSANCHEVAQLHHDVGRFFARHAARGKIRPQLAGLHGQTVFHQPDGPAPATFQLGEAAYLTELLQVPVVSNFRAADLAAGGQGAPLATSFHVQVFGKRGKHICINNLGGISNVTSIDWRSTRKPIVMAFDTGPANMLIDLVARHFGKGLMDRDGRNASRGKVVEELLEEWLRDPFFRKAPPKSTGREYFGEVFFDKIVRGRKLKHDDLLATLTEFTARSIALNYQLHLSSIPERVIFAGGGAKNRLLVAKLRDALQGLDKKIKTMTSEEAGWPSSAIEPAAFACLAFLRMMGRPGNLPETTGARHAVLLGQVSRPS
jgi:anhydro-N-acetylmuramic acid kinase